VFNKDDEQVVAILKGHTKKVNRVIYHPSGENTVITASYDATIRIWDVPTSQVKLKNNYHIQCKYAKLGSWDIKGS
jgi:pre-mRNA-processing factor 19